MAKVLYGNGVADMRGSVAGNVFSRNANSAYIRNRTAPAQANSEAQQSVRGLFGTIARSWRGLTEAQRASFVAQAQNYPFVNSLGQTFYLTGAQLFYKVNNAMQQIGQPAINTMVAPVEIIGIESVDLAFTISPIAFTATVNFTDGTTTVPAGQALVLQATAAQSLGKYRPKRPDFRNIDVITTGSAADINIIPLYTAVFGVPEQGKKVFVQAYTVSLVTGMAAKAVYKGIITPTV